MLMLQPHCLHYHHSQMLRKHDVERLTRSLRVRAMVRCRIEVAQRQKPMVLEDGDDIL